MPKNLTYEQRSGFILKRFQTLIQSASEDISKIKQEVFWEKTSHVAIPLRLRCQLLRLGELVEDVQKISKIPQKGQTELEKTLRADAEYLLKGYEEISKFCIPNPPSQYVLNTKIVLGKGGQAFTVDMR